MSNFVEFKHKGILINISKSIHERPSVYDCVRLAWRLDKQKASQYPFAFAMVDGHIVDIFAVDEWIDATAENFPDYAQMLEADNMAGRIGFVGREVSDVAMIKHYVNKEVPSEYRGMFPCRYLNPTTGENEEVSE